jgi:hypothetical protein
VILVLFLTIQASASIQTYTLGDPQNYGSDDLRVVVNVDDNTPGKLTFNVAIAPNVALPNTGDLFGVFLEFLPHPSLSESDFVGDDISKVIFEHIKDGGNNLEGTIESLVPGGKFDAVITLGKSGASGGLLTSTSFTLDATGGAILLSHLVGIGIRAQSVGAPPGGGGGSSKLYTMTPDPSIVSTGPAPEPATLTAWSCLAAMAMIWTHSRGIMRRNDD